MSTRGLFVFMAALASLPIGWAGADDAVRPIPLIFDTDIGNDIDDALALAVIHALESRGECKLLAVTVTKDNPFAAAFVDAINTFYGRPDIPIGVVRDGKAPEVGKYLEPILVAQDDGKPRYPHDLASGADAEDASTVLRRTLAAAKDGSVVIVQVGFSTNLARLLDTPADDVSSLTGRELVAKKCRLLSAMMGNFAAIAHPPEYNVFIDGESARKLCAEWPTPILASGFEIGRAIKYPAASILADFAWTPHHPVAEAYQQYMKMPYDRETWDLTSVLAAVRPERGYFAWSDPGTIAVDDQNNTQFRFHKDGRHRYLVVSDEQVARVREALVQLASQPTDR